MKAFYQNFVLSLCNTLFPFSDHHTIYRKFPRNFPEISRKFFGKFLNPHPPPLPMSHVTHPHTIPKTLNPPRTSMSIFSILHFYSKVTFITYPLQLRYPCYRNTRVFGKIHTYGHTHTNTKYMCIHIPKHTE